MTLSLYLLPVFCCTSIKLTFVSQKTDFAAANNNDILLVVLVLK